MIVYSRLNHVWLFQVSSLPFRVFSLFRALFIKNNINVVDGIFFNNAKPLKCRMAVTASQATGKFIVIKNLPSIRHTLKSCHISRDEKDTKKIFLLKKTTSSHSHLPHILNVHFSAGKQEELRYGGRCVHCSYDIHVVEPERRLFIFEMCLHRLKEEKQISWSLCKCRAAEPGTDWVHYLRQLHHVWYLSKSKNDWSQGFFNLHNKHEEIFR